MPDRKPAGGKRQDERFAGKGERRPAPSGEKSRRPGEGRPAKRFDADTPGQRPARERSQAGSARPEGKRNASGPSAGRSFAKPERRGEGDERRGPGKPASAGKPFAGERQSRPAKGKGEFSPRKGPGGFKKR